MEEEDWETLSYVKRSTYRTRILRYLYQVDEPRTPTEIGSKTDISRSHVSWTLINLKDKNSGLVEVINPNAHYDRRYRITGKGQEIVEKIQEIETE
ncbi:MAG: archaellum operon transcriptional activator EarA family protein [Candidatus Nanohaloarchaea archaeon]